MLNKLKQVRAVATRYDKRAYMYEATFEIAIMKSDSATSPEVHETH